MMSIVSRRKWGLAAISVAVVVLVIVLCNRRSLGPLDLSDMPPSLSQTLPGGVLSAPSWGNDDADEPFPVGSYFNNRRPSADNAAPLYFAAMADVVTNMDFVYPPDLWKERLPRVKAFQEELFEVLRPFFEEKSKRPTLAKVERVLADARPSLEKLARAQEKKRCVFICGLSMDSPLPHCGAACMLAHLNYLRLYHASQTGNAVETETAVTQMLRLARDLRPRGRTDCQFASARVESMALRGITQFTLTQQGLTPQVCDRLMTLLASHQCEALPCIEEMLKMEYIILRNAIANFKQGRLSRQDLARQFSVWPKQVDNANWANEIAALAKVHLASVAFLSQPYYRISPSRFDKIEMPTLWKLGPLVANTLIQRRTLAKWQAEHRVEFNGTLCLIAVQRYAIVHRKPPERLDDALREAGVTSAPEDPFDGHSMRYAVLDGEPVVYSVGPDRIDHGGRKSWRNGSQPGDIILGIGTER